MTALADRLEAWAQNEEMVDHGITATLPSPPSSPRWMPSGREPMGKRRKWGGFAPRDIPQRGRRKGQKVWCYADPSGLDIVCRKQDDTTTIARLTWRQLRDLMRDYGATPE